MSESPLSTFFSIGFRPFYLGAAVYACLAMPLWLVAFLDSGGGRPPDLGWHTHEMLYGFAAAVIAGFLLTAVRTWTGRPTPANFGLAALFLLWLAGRVLMFLTLGAVSSTSAIWIALVDVSFLPALTICLGIPLWRSRNRRNAFVLLILTFLAFSNVLFHGIRFGWVSQLPANGATPLAFDLIALLMVVIAGRVIPAFSANAITNLQPRTWPLIEFSAIALPLAVAIFDFWALWFEVATATPYRWLLWLAGITHLIRLSGWQPWRMLTNPLLIALPLAYAWIPVHFLLRAWHGGSPGVTSSFASHALVVGAMAGLMLAMMTRSALGHTGRQLIARRPELIMFGAIHLAALARVAGPLLLPGPYRIWILIAGCSWTLAFASFAFAYLPILIGRRIEPGQTTE